MSGKRTRNAKDHDAAALLRTLMADRGWFAADVERESKRTGHPQRIASKRTVYRVTNEGYVPSTASQFEIAAAFGLLPSHVWGDAPLPAAFAYLGADRMAA